MMILLFMAVNYVDRKDNMQTHILSPFVFAPQMKIQVFSLEAWCEI